MNQGTTPSVAGRDSWYYLPAEMIWLVDWILLEKLTRPRYNNRSECLALPTPCPDIGSQGYVRRNVWIREVKIPCTEYTFTEFAHSSVGLFSLGVI